MMKTKVIALLLTLGVVVGLAGTPVGGQSVERARSFVSSLTSATWVRTGDGTVGAPSYGFTNVPGTGMWRDSGGYLEFSEAGASMAILEASNGWKVRSDAFYGWSSSTAPSAAADAQLGRTAAGQIYAGTTTTQPVINGTLNTYTTSTCTIANTTETDLWTYTLPAGALNADGRGLRLTAWGTFGANANVKTVKPYFGATVLINWAAAANGNGWMTSVSILRTSATAQTASAGLQSNSGTYVFSGVTTPAETMANAIVVKITGTNGTASANDICLKGAILETIK